MWTDLIDGLEVYICRSDIQSGLLSHQRGVFIGCTIVHINHECKLFTCVLCNM